MPLAVSIPTWLVESSILQTFWFVLAGKRVFQRPVLIFNHIKWLETEEARNRLKSAESPFGNSPWFRKIPKTTYFGRFYSYNWLYALFWYLGKAFIDKRNESRVNNKQFKGFIVGKPGDSLSRLSKKFLALFKGFFRILEFGVFRRLKPWLTLFRRDMFFSGIVR